MTTMLSYKTRPSHAGLLAFAAFCASTTSAHAQTATAAATARAAPVEYSVVNLGPDAGNAVLNKNGQTAYATWWSGDANIFNGFFDGKRVHVLGSLGGTYTVVRGLNNHGVVVGESRDALSNDRAFTWSASRGMRALPGPTLATAHAVNDANQVAGAVRGGTDSPPFPYVRANRWDANGALTRLGPAPARLSEASDINESGVSVGYSEVQLYDSRAMVWDKAGNATDLGKFGGTQSSAKRINDSGQVLGTYYHRDGRGIGFLWSKKQGMVRIGPDSGDQYVTALNDNGEVSGNNLVVGADQTYRYTPFLWSAPRGMRSLPINGALDARVQALNNARQMVGYLERTFDDPLTRRAVLWNDVAAPVDLNTRLYRAPAGLVLYAATAINDSGAIVADSNAGLVLLRPGREGSSAPVLGAIFGGAANGAVALKATVDFAVNFVDSAAAETHVAAASVNDGCPSTPASLRERRGVGDVSLRHTFCKAGAFIVKIKVTDRAGNATQVQRRLVVTDPAAPQG